MKKIIVALIVVICLAISGVAQQYPTEEVTVPAFTLTQIGSEIIRMHSAEIFNLFIEFLFAIVFIPIFVWSYQKTCVPRRMLVSDSSNEKIKKWQIINNDSDTNWIRTIHLALFMIWSIFSAIVVFC